ncbi:hypothetical protein PRK78_004333 [Emydomyces testavorans]|uniref:non-specific serine/threonine protein kinase n=1 Tax=Emydomyces testavorans TaxID=2070801 RepID=A0AAF0DLC1_9EURO|nr:hypothetical protein PRK78_004333 [Emydomyces testavorans]
MNRLLTSEPYLDPEPGHRLEVDHLVIVRPPGFNQDLRFSHPEYPHEEYNPFSPKKPDNKEHSANRDHCDKVQSETENWGRGLLRYHFGLDQTIQDKSDFGLPFASREFQGFDSSSTNLRQAYQASERGQPLFFPKPCVSHKGKDTLRTTEQAEPCVQGTAAVERGVSLAFGKARAPPEESENNSPIQDPDSSSIQYTPSRYSEAGSIDCQDNTSRQRNILHRNSNERSNTFLTHEPHPNLGSWSQLCQSPLSPTLSSRTPPRPRIERQKPPESPSLRTRVRSQQRPIFPHPHQFDTRSNRTQFDPLNFFPSPANVHGSLKLPRRVPVIRRVTEPVGKPTSDTTQIVVEPPTSHRRGVTQPCSPANTTVAFEPSVPRNRERITTSSEVPKPRKKSIHRLAESIRKLFQPRDTSETSDNSPQTSKRKFSLAKRKLSLSNRFFRRPSQQQVLEDTFELKTRQPPVPKMDRSRFLDPSSAMMALTKQKSEAMRLAREQATAVAEMCRRARSDVPPYTFEELIGKGSYGRVYKGRQLSTQKLVAIKVMDIDKLDYKIIRDMKDESIKDFIHETKVLQQVKDAGAKNINMFIEAVSIHSQLWLICEYCPGGSVKTLMRATGDKLEEKFIIPIARELAEGLKAIHDAGIIHRDVKAANILIHEEGRLQICDFGVAGVLQTKFDKRSTWIGTPHWMPPEMFPNRIAEPHQYGSEVDVWAYGCTLFECATGNPPNATLRERMQIGRQLNRFTPKLEGDTYSEELRLLVSYSLTSDPKTRPTMRDILDHEYIARFKETHSTNILSELVRIYYQWSQRGGQRISLFNPGGAAAAEMPDPMGALESEDWNFSTTAGFEKRHSILNLDELSASLAALDDDLTPTAAPRTMGQSSEMTPEEKANFDERVKRGAAAMQGLFDEAQPDYKYETKNDFVPVQQKQRRSSDLPLRTDTDRSSVTSTFIDINLGDYESAHYAAGSASHNPPFQLADPDTIRANRSSARLFRNSSSSSSASQEFQPRGPRPPTMEWTFESATRISDEPDTISQDDVHGESPLEEETFKTDKRETMAWTFPVMTPDEGAPGDDPIIEDGPGDSEAEEQSVAEPIYPWRTDPEGTIRGANRPFPALQPPPSGRRHSGRTEPPAESRPATAVSAQSDTDQNPFRFDATRTSSNPGTPREVLADRFPTMPPSSFYEDYETSTLVSSFNDYPETNWSQDVTLRNGNSTEQKRRSVVSSLHSSESRRGEAVPEIDKPSSLYFPEPMPPSSECLAEGASEDVVSAELDRLLGELTQGLASTREALTATYCLRAARGGEHGGREV